MASATAALERRLDRRLVAISRPKTIASGWRMESRRNARSSSYRVGAAIFDPGNQATCRILDRSESGLRLEFCSAGDCPDEFALRIPTLGFIGIVRTAWRKGALAGVSILRWSDTTQRR